MVYYTVYKMCKDVYEVSNLAYDNLVVAWYHANLVGTW
jgi:hypothetical protein